MADGLLPPPLPPTLPPPAPPDGSRSGRRARRVVLAVVCAVVVVGVLGAAAVLVLRRGSGGDSDTVAAGSTTPPTSEAAPTTATTVPPTTVAATSPATTIAVVAPGGEDPRALPAEVDGYRPYGEVQSTVLRLFPGEPWSDAPGFEGQMNRCATAFWTVRWRSLSGGMVGAATRGFIVDPATTPPPLPSDFRMGEAGYLSGYICDQPIFMLDADSAGFVDVVIEWQYWDIAVDQAATTVPPPTTVAPPTVPPTTVPPTTVPPPTAAPPTAPPTAPPPPATTAAARRCPRLNYTFDLPVGMCDEGFLVSVIQQALVNAGYWSIEVDGQFGPASEGAVRHFQASHGLVADGLVGPATWRALVPYMDIGDLDGDGSVTPDDIIYD